LGRFILLAIAVLVAWAVAPHTTIVLGTFALAVFIAYRYVRHTKRSRTPNAHQLVQRLDSVRMMSGTQFELFVADLFRAMGHSARVLGGSGDQGVDVILDYQGERVAVQCKNYGKAVGNKPVQEVYAGARYHGCNSAWVVAPAGFTKGAVELARRVGVTLYDASALRTWIRRIDKQERDKQGGTPANQTRRTVDLDTGIIRRKGNTMMESGTEKHTISVGVGEYGETVAFTANKLGTAEVNGGSGSGGLELTVYRLPDNTYRALAEQGDVRLLEPSNFLDVFTTDQPAEYGRWTYEEAEADETYGDMFTKFMAKHPAGRKHVVRDLD
jgi:restriction system protein